MLSFLQIRVQIDQHFTVHHADFVDDQVLTMGPMFRFTAYFFLRWLPIGRLAALWRVIPATLKAAVPVGAVTTSSFCRFSTAYHARTAAIKRLFPVPPSPNTPSRNCGPTLLLSKSMICNDTKDARLYFVQRELMNYIHNRRVVVGTIGEEDVRGLVCAVAGHTGLLTRRGGGGGGVAEPVRLDLKIGERKVKGIDVVYNRIRCLGR